MQLNWIDEKLSFSQYLKPGQKKKFISQMYKLSQVTKAIKCLITQDKYPLWIRKKIYKNKKLCKPTHNLELNGLPIQFHRSDFLKTNHRRLAIRSKIHRQWPITALFAIFLKKKRMATVSRLTKSTPIVLI